MPLLSWEKTLTCPYNPAHQITPARMQTHLVKCRRSHEDSDVVICQFNACHHIPKQEEQYHHDNCPDRKIVELAMYRAAKGEVNLNPRPIVSQSSVCLDVDAENWELEAAGHKSYDPKKKCEKSNVLRKIQGATPSERKKFYAAEKIRLENLKTMPQSEEEEKKAEEEKAVEKEKGPRVVRASQEPLRRPTVERRQQEAASVTSSSSRQGSITSRLLGLLPPSTEPRRRPGSILNPGIGAIGAISELDDTVLSDGTLNSRLGRLALGGRGRGAAIRKVMN